MLNHQASKQKKSLSPSFHNVANSQFSHCQREVVHCKGQDVRSQETKIQTDGAEGGRELGQINLNNNGRQIAKFIIPMLKNQTVNHNTYELILCKMRGSSSEPPLVINFQPSSRTDQLTESILPRFNTDRQHFTPAFLLSSDERFYRQNVNFERVKFDERIQNAQEKSIIPNSHKVSPPSNYCQLCRTNYQDYLDHTRCPHHLALIADSPANQFIHDLVQQFARTPPHRKPIAKPKRVAQRKREDGCGEEKVGRGGKGKMQATCSRTSNQSTNVMEETIRVQNY